MNTHSPLGQNSREPADVLARMTALMRDRGDDAGITEAELRQNFSEQEITRHGAVAAAMASKRCVRDVDQSNDDADEEARLAVERQPRHTPEHASSIVMDMLPNRPAVTRQLLAHGYTNEELARFMPAIGAIVGKQFFQRVQS